MSAQDAAQLNMVAATLHHSAIAQLQFALALMYSGRMDSYCNWLSSYYPRWDKADFVEVESLKRGDGES